MRKAKKLSLLVYSEMVPTTIVMVSVLAVSLLRLTLTRSGVFLTIHGRTQLRKIPAIAITTGASTYLPISSTMLVSRSRSILSLLQLLMVVLSLQRQRIFLTMLTMMSTMPHIHGLRLRQTISMPTSFLTTIVLLGADVLL